MLVCFDENGGPISVVNTLGWKANPAVSGRVERGPAKHFTPHLVASRFPKGCAVRPASVALRHFCTPGGRIV